MIITCPSCQARYPVDAASFAPSGRKVRCKKCGHVWHQAALESEAAQPASRPAVQSELGLPPQPAAEAAPKPVAEPKVKIEAPAAPAPEPQAPEPKFEQPAAPFKFEAAPDDSPLFDQPAKSTDKKRRGIDLGAKDVPIVMAEVPDTQSGMGGKLRAFVHDAAFTRRSRIVNILGWTLLVAFVLGSLFGLYHYRMQIASLWPKSTKAYEVVDLPINLRGIEFRNVSYERQTENGLPVLAVKGEVFNISEGTRVLPPLRVILRDKDQKEIFYWTFSLPEKELAPQQSAEFVTRLSSPPANARDLEVRFVRKGEALGATPSADAAAPASDPVLTPPATTAPDAAAPTGEGADHPAP